jgi:hypothetical protein
MENDSLNKRRDAFGAMVRENRQLVTDEPVEFAK